jgi:UDP-N-acetylmuramate dehydrogenase
MKVQQNVSLKAFNTFGIDKNAKFFSIVKGQEELIQALIWARTRNESVLILGGGSNVLLTKDFDGLVIKMEISGINIVAEDSNNIFLEVGAGEVWHDLVVFTLAENWAGLENLSLIPGTVGASPMQNIGAYGVELKDIFHSLKALNRETLEIESFDSAACKFGYRESVFKHELKDKYIITSVTFCLNKSPEFNVEYGAIQDVLKEKGDKELTIQAISQAVIQIRKSKLPDPKEIGNAGSFFKNPTISTYHFEKLRSENPSIPGYPSNEGVKVPAGWLIEHAGWKGKRVGEVGVHSKQALVLVNYGKGTGEEIQKLSQDIIKSVWDQFKVELSPEVNFV